MSYPPQYPGPPGPPPGPPGYPGYPGPQPPKKKTGLIVGLVIGGLVVIAAVVVLVITLSGPSKAQQDIANDHGIQSASPPPLSKQPASGPSSTRGSSGSSSRSAGGSASSPAELQSAIVDAYNDRDADALSALSCQPMAAADLQQLKDTLAKVPPQVTYAAAGSPQASGSNATLNFSASGGGNSQTFSMQATQSGGGWCISG